MKQAKWFLLLHIILGIYAGSSVCSKLAAQQPFLSAAFIVLFVRADNEGEGGQ